MGADINRAIYGRKYNGLYRSDFDSMNQGKTQMKAQFLEPWISKAGFIHNEMLEVFIVDKFFLSAMTTRNEVALIDRMIVLCSEYFIDRYVSDASIKDAVKPLLQSFILVQTNQLQEFNRSGSFSPIQKVATSNQFSRLFQMLIGTYSSEIAFEEMVESVKAESQVDLNGVEREVMTMNVAIAKASLNYWNQQLRLSNSNWFHSAPTNEVARSNPPGWVNADIVSGGSAMIQAAAAVWIPVIGPPASAGAIIGSAAIGSGVYAALKYFG